MEKQEIVRILDEISEHTRTMLSSPADDRVINYQHMDPLLLCLEGELSRTPNHEASNKLGELKVHLIAMARLDDSDGHTDDEHCAWAQKAIEDLRRHFGKHSI